MDPEKGTLGGSNSRHITQRKGLNVDWYHHYVILLLINRLHSDDSCGAMVRKIYRHMSESVRHPTSFLLSKNIAHCVRTHSTVKSHVRYNKTIFYCTMSTLQKNTHISR